MFEGQVLTLTSVTAVGLTVQDLEEYFDPAVYAENVHLVTDIITMSRLPDEAGAEVWYYYINTPIVVANRCQFSY